MSDTNAQVNATNANVETVESTDTSTEAQKVHSDEAQNGKTDGAETLNQQKDNSEKTFTQKEVSALVAREVKKAADAAKAAIAQEAADKDKTESQKLQDKLIEAATREEGLKGKLRTQAIKMAARDEAEKQKVAFEGNGLDDAFALKLFESVEVDDDGNVTGIDTAIKDIAKTRPYLLKQNSRREAPDLDATANGKGSGFISLEEQAAIASQYGMPVRN